MRPVVGHRSTMHYNTSKDFTKKYYDFSRTQLLSGVPSSETRFAVHCRPVSHGEPPFLLGINKVVVGSIYFIFKRNVCESLFI